MAKEKSQLIKNPEKAHEDYEQLVDSLEQELLDIIGFDKEPEEKRNANATHVADLAKRFLEHPVAETSLDRINWHIRYALASKFDEVRSKYSYKDKRIVASGGAEVDYVLATESDEGKPLAVKILRPDLNDHMKKVFENEQAVLAKLWFFYKSNYPKNIVKLHAVGDGVTATERIAGGEKLENAMENGSSLSEVVGWIKDIVDGQEALYKAGFSSNPDLAPGNCVLGSDGIVRILDLSLVKKEPYALPQGQYRSSGRYMYMPPEKCIHYTIGEEHKKPIIDQRADVYILGIMIHQFLTQGKDPFGRHDFNDEEKKDKDGMVLGALAKDLERYGLDFYTGKGDLISKEKISRFADKYQARRLSHHGCPYIDSNEILGKIDQLIVSCFHFDLDMRPKSPKDLLQKLLSILEPILSKE